MSNFQLSTQTLEEEMTDTKLVLDDDELLLLIKKDLRNLATAEEVQQLHKSENRRLWHDELINLMCSLDYQLSSLKLRIRQDRAKAIANDTLEEYEASIAQDNDTPYKKRVDILKLKMLAQTRLRYVKRLLASTTDQKSTADTENDAELLHTVVN